jgi:hypothetical protein
MKSTRIPSVISAARLIALGCAGVGFGLSACGGGDGADAAGSGASQNGTGGRFFGGTGGGNNGGPGNQGTPDYQPNFIERGRPPGPPERGYTAVEADLSGEGAGALCALCADSADCADGACLIQMDTGEMFCAHACDSDADCPDPELQECVTAADAESAQCVPRLGTCYEFDPTAEPINPIHEPGYIPPDSPAQGGQGGQNG